MSEFSRINPCNAIPDWLLKRLGGKERPDGLEYTCPSCGEMISPIQYINGWVPGRCRCKNKNEEHFHNVVHKERQEIEKTNREVSCRKCYTWINEPIGDLQEKTFETYHRNCFPNAYDQLYQFACAEEPLPWRNFIVLGNCGTGKTHLVTAAINFLCKRGIPCRFATVQGLFDAISTCLSEQRDYTHIVHEAGSIPAIVLDDIDKLWVRDMEESFQMGILFNIINKRYTQHLPTIITTNAHNIAPYVGEAGFSRLKERGQLIVMMGGDFRDRTFLR